MGQSLTLAGPDDTAALAQAFAGLIPADPAGWMVLLQGELGAGKSTFARALLRALGHDGPVPSPTYTLVEPYELPQFSVYHVDLYRIADEEELEFLGWGDLSDGLTLVEWPERIPGIEHTADVRIEFAYAGDGRTARVQGLSARGSRLAAEIAA
jgi:tRNA threonylcarbamoyladenosine biosynthesis protein TsaE